MDWISLEMEVDEYKILDIFSRHNWWNYQTLLPPSEAELFSDIDLTDPEVEAAAAKIQSVFKMRGKKMAEKK